MASPSTPPVPAAAVHRPGPPLNRERPLQPWARLAPDWLDFNPCCVQLPSGRWIGIVRRDRVPPVPGQGTLWTVPLDDTLQPAGPPTLLLARGEDPRAVLLGGRVFVFHCVIERDEQQRVCGSAVRLLECAIDGPPGAEVLRPLNLMALPKNPLNRPSTGSPHEAWEKNWVPFVHGPAEIGLIYDHAPWSVLMLTVASEPPGHRFSQAWSGPALRWAWGEIRGGTVPVRWAREPGGPEHWLTFFHSSQVVGSRKLYCVGAALFDTEAPFTPRWMTPEPLLVAPYRSGAHQHGWRFAGSVVFPLGCARMPGGHRLLCGVDDGLVAPYPVSDDELRQRLLPLAEALPAPQALATTDGDRCPANGEPWLLGAHDERALQAARLLALLHPGGGWLLDAAPGDGVPLARLAPLCAGASAWAAPAEQGPLRRLLALNGLHEQVQVQAPPADLALDGLAPTPAPLALLRVDDGQRAAPVLLGAVDTLRRDRPLVLLQMPDEPAAAAQVAAALDRAQYTCEAMFPFTPQRRLALPAEQRERFCWMV